MIRKAFVTFALAASAMTVAGCSEKATEQPEIDGSAKQTTAPTADWRASGFEQLEAKYVWTGSGMRDDVFQSHLALSVPETDDAIWSSECTADGAVKTLLFLNPPGNMENNRTTLKFGTDISAEPLQYEARFISGGQYDGLEIVQNTDDQMFAEMKGANWAYVQLGDGPDAVKLKLSLANAAQALRAFLPACRTS
jgi:hypothetical protein